MGIDRRRADMTSSARAAQLFRIPALGPLMQRVDWLRRVVVLRHGAPWMMRRPLGASESRIHDARRRGEARARETLAGLGTSLR
jgi:hypothetical protein